MKSELPTSTVDEMCELVVDCPHFTPEWTKSGFLVIRNQNIRNGRLNLSDRSYTHEHDFLRRIKRAKPRAGDIIFTREAPMGEVCILPEGLECCLGQRQVLLRPKPELSGRYLFYALQSPYVRHQIFWNEGTGSTVSNVRIPALKTLKIPRRNNEEAIAGLLAALDNKIELNRRMNGTLELMARAIFKDWFVDFGPTRAKMEGRAPYLAPDPWNLFPARLDPNTGLPEGWEVGTLADVAEPERRTVNPADMPGGTPYIGLEHMPRRCIALAEWDSSNEVSSNKSVFEAGDFLFGKLRPYFHKVGIAPVDGICSTDIVVLRSSRPHWQAFVLACISSEDFVAYTDQTSTGTKMPRTSWKTMSRYELCIPDDQIAEQFQAIVAPMLARIARNIHESRTLAKTRDLLLPKLMSGEIRVGETGEAETVA